MDVSARIQLFDLKKKYSFQTAPGVDRYNMPLYDVQTAPPGSGQNIGLYPVYQGFLDPVYISGVQANFTTLEKNFYANYPNFVQNISTVAVGNGTRGPYTFNLGLLPEVALPENPPFQGIIRGHIDIGGIVAVATDIGNIDPPVVDSMTAIGSGGPGTIQQVPVTSVEPGVYITTQNASGASMVVTDSGQFLDGAVNYGLFMYPGKAPFGNRPIPEGYSITLNTVNYFTGDCVVYFQSIVPVGVNINAQCYFFQTGLPRTVLFYNNTLVLRAPPAQQYLVELEAYMTPAAFLNLADPVTYGYMSEYIARGAARKILSDTGDLEQFAFYEPLFREQEMLVWKRSQRIFTSTRTPTIYMTNDDSMGNSASGNFGGYA